MEKAAECQKNIYFCFIDYAKAFDCVDHNKLWKILLEMEIPDNLTCLLRNLYTGQEATVRTGYGTTDWFQIGKGARQGGILSPCLFNLYAEYWMKVNLIFQIFAVMCLALILIIYFYCFSLKSFQSFSSREFSFMISLIIFPWLFSSLRILFTFWGFSINLFSNHF